jgi:cysteinyl-tRNA synthetase
MEGSEEIYQELNNFMKALDGDFETNVKMNAILKIYKNLAGAENVEQVDMREKALSIIQLIQAAPDKIRSQVTQGILETI